MECSVKGRKLIEHFEGLRLTAYHCPAGVLTIGYGHTSRAGAPTVVPGQHISAVEADEILALDLKNVQYAVEFGLKKPCTQGEYDALCSFTFNVGIGAFRGSTLLKKFNAGDTQGAALEFQKWTRAGGHVVEGLVLRRHAEMLEFCDHGSGLLVPSRGANEMPREVDSGDE